MGVLTKVEFWPRARLIICESKAFSRCGRRRFSTKQTGGQLISSRRMCRNRARRGSSRCVFAHRFLRREDGLTAYGGSAIIRSAMRIGAVNYLNSKPLVCGLDALGPEVRLSFDLP